MSVLRAPDKSRKQYLSHISRAKLKQYDTFLTEETRNDNLTVDEENKENINPKDSAGFYSIDVRSTKIGYRNIEMTKDLQATIFHKLLDHLKTTFFLDFYVGDILINLVENEVTLPNNFHEILQINNDKIIIFMLTIMSNTDHANIIIVDNLTVIRYEPHGHANSFYSQGSIDFLIYKIFEDYRCIYPNMYQRANSLQSFEKFTKPAGLTDLKKDEYSGYCYVFCLLFLHTYIEHSFLPENENYKTNIQYFVFYLERIFKEEEIPLVIRAYLTWLLNNHGMITRSYTKIENY